MSYDIFISFAPSELGLVKQLQQYLNQQGYTAWFYQDKSTDQELQAAAALLKTVNQINSEIKQCQLFLLLLSAEAVNNAVVKQQINLAQQYQKPMFVVLWREPQITPALAYQFVGCNWTSLTETDPPQFANLKPILNKIVEQFHPPQEKITVEDVIEDETTPFAREIGHKYLDRPFSRRTTLDFLAILDDIITKVVNPIISNADSQTTIQTELTWLFTATDHFLTVAEGKIDPEQPIKYPISANVTRSPKANNYLLQDNEDMILYESLQDMLNQVGANIESLFTRLNIYLHNLDSLLNQEEMSGEFSKLQPHIHNQITTNRIQIVKILQLMAKLINTHYGVLINSPEQLAKQLGV